MLTPLGGGRLGRWQPAAQVDAWPIVASLAALGWTLDSLRTYLAMHGPLWAGLGSAAQHFWYFVPLAMVTAVLLRARRPPLTVRRAARFSGDVADREVGARNPRPRLQADNRVAYDLLEGLDTRAAAIATNMLRSPLESRILSHFRAYPRMAIRAVDLAFWIDTTAAELEVPLAEMTDLGLLTRLDVLGEAFYRLSDQPEIEEVLDRLFAWRDAWRSTLLRLEPLFGGGIPRMANHANPAWAEATAQGRP